MTTTTDESALLRAIIAHPDEDTPRLMYADWLEENAGECPKCDGTGWERVADAAGDMDDIQCRACRGAGVDFRHERAEFIRLQVQLARPDSQLPKCARCGESGIKGELYSSGGPDSWVTCPACDGDGTARKAMQARVDDIWSSRQFYAIKGLFAIHWAYDPSHGMGEPLLNKYAFVSRGFVGDLYFPRMADVCRRERVKCQTCRGTGTRYVYDRDNGDYRQEACFDCSHGLAAGDWQFTKAALDLAREQPIQRVWVGDAAPEVSSDATGDSRCYIWSVSFSEIATVHHVPPIVFRELPANIFDAESEARDALAVAIAKALRKAAGITQGESHD